MSVTDNQVVVQTPDPGHRPTGELDLPPQALRRHCPGKSDQAVTPGRNRDAVGLQPGIAGECVADRGFDVERLPTRVAPCGGIPHHALVHTDRHHTDTDSRSAAPATNDRLRLKSIARAYAAGGRGGRAQGPEHRRRVPPQYLWRRDALTGSAPIRMLFSTTSDAGRSRQASSTCRSSAHAGARLCLGGCSGCSRRGDAGRRRPGARPDPHPVPTVSAHGADGSTGAVLRRVAGINAMALGLGVAFLAFGLPPMRRLVPAGRAGRSRRTSRSRGC
jgi:hypothetical protein